MSYLMTQEQDTDYIEVTDLLLNPIAHFYGDNAKHNAAIFIAALKMKEKHQ